jgi:condensin complex subunit 2
MFSIDENAPAATGTRAKREKKEAFKIDFTTLSEKTFKEASKELFAPVARGAGLTLPGKSRKSRKTKDKEEPKDRDVHLLPDDMHFSSRDLVTLFLKPDFQVRMRLLNAL